MSEILSPEAIREVMSSVLFTPEEIDDDGWPADAVRVEGILTTFGFHPGRLRDATPRVAAMLRELPEQFHRDAGGGWSFLSGCTDKNGEQWGEQFHVESLVCLGIATGQASWLGREIMTALPGGVPYFEVHPEEAP